MADALGQDAYKALFGMLVSEDEAVRKKAAQLAGKLTPDEAQQFFDFQHAANPVDAERSRIDNSVGGMPPEAAVVSGIGAGRLLLGNVAHAGAAGASRVMAAGKTAAQLATPVLKEEMTRRALESMGVPTVIAAPIGTLVGMHGLRPSAVTAEGAPAAEVTAPAARAAVQPAAPVVAPPAVELPPTVARPLSPPMTPSALKASLMKSGLSDEVADAFIAKLQAGKGNPGRLLPEAPSATDMAGGPSILTPEATAQRLATVTPKTLNELAIAARRNKVQLTAADYGKLVPKVQAGMAPADAVAELAATKLSPIEQLKASSSFAGLPTPEEAEALMDARWQRGEIKSPSATLAKKMHGK